MVETFNPNNLDYKVDFIPLANEDGSSDPTGFFPPDDSPIEFEAHDKPGILQLGYTASIILKIHDRILWSRHERGVVVYDSDRAKMGQKFEVYSYAQIKRWRATKLPVPGIDT